MSLTVPSAHGVRGEVALVALADQDAECSLPDANVAAGPGSVVGAVGLARKPPLEQLDRTLQFRRRLVGQRLGDELPLDAQFE